MAWEVRNPRPSRCSASVSGRSKVKMILHLLQASVGYQWHWYGYLGALGAHGAWEGKTRRLGSCMTLRVRTPWALSSGCLCVLNLVPSFYWSCYSDTYTLFLFHSLAPSSLSFSFYYYFLPLGCFSPFFLFHSFPFPFPGLSLMPFYWWAPHVVRF